MLTHVALQAWLVLSVCFLTADPRPPSPISAKARSVHARAQVPVLALSVTVFLPRRLLPAVILAAVSQSSLGRYSAKPSAGKSAPARDASKRKRGTQPPGKSTGKTPASRGEHPGGATAAGSGSPEAPKDAPAGGSPVPEPRVLVIVGSGLLALSLLRRKRFRSAS